MHARVKEERYCTVSMSIQKKCMMVSDADLVTTPVSLA